MRRRFATGAAAAALILTIHAVADATLINNANGTVTDTATGYRWMTLDQFSNLTYSQMLSRLLPGFHAASALELSTLTYDMPANPATYAADAAAMGVTSSMIWGYFGNGYQWAWRSETDTVWNTNNSSAYGWSNRNYHILGGDTAPNLGLFAVNTATPVPEPGTLLLLAAGLATLTLTRLKRR